MKKHWWKVLALILMLYVFIAGLLIPLKPGIQSLNKQTTTTGETFVLEISGYNTDFQESEVIRSWLRLGKPRTSDEGLDTALVAKTLKVIARDKLEVVFEIPSFLPSTKGVERASLIVDDPTEGAFVFPEAIVVKQPERLAGPNDPHRWLTKIENLSPARGVTFPYRGLLAETIRNQYFHVSLWFGLMFLMLGAAIRAGMYLRTSNPVHDLQSQALTRVGLLFGVLGLLTGMVWANYTWGKPWSGDVKQNMTAIALLIYFAYFILRSSLNSEQQSARLGAVYNIFAFAFLIPLLYVIPRMKDSLHPGAGGNPGFGGEDLDNTMRMVFYPAIIAFTLVGFWVANLWRRAKQLELKFLLKQLS